MSTTVEQALVGHAQVMESINSWTEAEFAQADSNGPYVLRAAAWPFRSTARACGLDIDYDADLGDEIASAVMRVDELGDLIDGEFRPREIDQLLASLRS